MEDKDLDINWEDEEEEETGGDFEIEDDVDEVEEDSFEDEEVE